MVPDSVDVGGGEKVVPDSVDVGNGAGSVEESESFCRLIALMRASNAFI
jgi:hypothetical protein